MLIHEFKLLVNAKRTDRHLPIRSFGAEDEI